MRTSTWKALLWREILLTRKEMIHTLLLFALGAALGVLGMLSLSVGNLQFIQDTEIRNMIEAMIIIYPAIVALAFIFLPLKVTCKDENVGWRRFRCTTPIPSVQFALASFSFLLALFVLGTVLMISYIAIAFCISGRGFAGEVLAGSLTVTFVALIATVLIQILTMFFHSMDKAGFFLITVWFVACCIFASSSTGTLQELPADTVWFLFKKCAAYLPLAATVGVIALVAGFAGMTLLLKRREK